MSASPNIKNNKIDIYSELKLLIFQSLDSELNIINFSNPYIRIKSIGIIY